MKMKAIDASQSYYRFIKQIIYFIKFQGIGYLLYKISLPEVLQIC